MANAGAGLPCSDPPFTPLIMFTCTYEAQIGNIRRPHEELSAVLAPLVASSTGAVKALNSNFTHICQPGYERFLKRPKVRTKARGHGARPAPAVVRRRKPQGDATCFNSALELTIIPSEDDNPPPSVRVLYDQKPFKYYAVKSFPSTGQTQVPGVVCPDLADGSFIAGLWADFLTKMKLGSDPDEPVLLTKQRPIMVNFKFQLNCGGDRVMFILTQIVALLEGVKRSNSAPFPIREIKHPQDGQNLSFKCVCPTERNGEKKIRVNIFFRGKVNILGACDLEAPKIIYDFLSKFIVANWGVCVGQQPLPDRVLQKPPPPPTVDDELGDLFEDLNDLSLNQVKGENVKDN